MLVIAGTINLDPDHVNEMLDAIVPLMLLFPPHGIA